MYLIIKYIKSILIKKSKQPPQQFQNLRQSQQHFTPQPTYNPNINNPPQNFKKEAFQHGHSKPVKSREYVNDNNLETPLTNFRPQSNQETTFTKIPKTNNFFNQPGNNVYEMGRNANLNPKPNTQQGFMQNNGREKRFDNSRNVYGFNNNNNNNNGSQPMQKNFNQQRINNNIYNPQKNLNK